MSDTRTAWRLAGLVAGLAGLATSYVTAAALSVRASPVEAVGELVIRLTPGAVVEQAIQTFRHDDKPVLLAGVLLVVLLLLTLIGAQARVAWWRALVGYLLLSAVGVVAVVSAPDFTGRDLLPVLVGLLTWVACLGVLRSLLQREDAARPDGGGSVSRRGFLVGTAAMGAVAIGLGAIGRAVGAARQRVEESRRLLRLPHVSDPAHNPDVTVGPPGTSPWQTPNDDFYLIHTALVPPAITPSEWSLRIHGMVDKPMTLTYQDLLDRKLTEAWITLNCVSNEVGGDLIGNAHWSGVRLDKLLAEVGVQAGADAVKQTSKDGWTCGTPLSALTDGRDAMLAIAMNGEPLPIDHGFPVRVIVPGLYGFVSATKWVVDLEVTTFDSFTAYWTMRGWAAQAPVKISSRIDVPRDGSSVSSGSVRLGGMAWAQHTGISAVEVAVDGGDWQPAEVGGAPSTDTWVQWAASVDLSPGKHSLRVRATDANGLVQTGEYADVVPDGATGWHTIEVTAG